MKSVDIDRTKQLKDQPHTGHNRWHPEIPPIVEAEEGEEVVLQTRDALDGSLTLEPLRLTSPTWSRGIFIPSLALYW